MWNNSIGQGLSPAVEQTPQVIEITFGANDSIWLTGALYQWDTGQVLHFNDGFPDGTEVQFGRRRDAQTINRMIEGGYVKIPDICLQSSENLIGWVVAVGEDHQTTVKRVQLSIKKRNKPADYVAPEDEQTFREWVQSQIRQAAEHAAALVENTSLIRYGAVGDGVTDDTAALNTALNQSNVVIDGGNKPYKYLKIRMADAENVEVRNVIFTGGQNMDIQRCKKITFRNCQWVNVNDNGEDVQTYGVKLVYPNPDAVEEMPGNEDISFYGCTFRDVWYNTHFTGTGMAHHTTGIGMLADNVHNLTVRDCVFTQIKGNAAIHFNHWKSRLGFVDISDNLFYLNAWGGICMYRYTSVYPTVNGLIQGNRFIGCGLGYIPDEYLYAIAEQYRGVGCAALLGGASSSAAPYKQHFSCENNVFIDNCESSIEGPCWNPCIGNYCYGQGTLQDEENCLAMQEKYHLDYPLRVRYNPSVNFIYRNLYANADGSPMYPEHAPMLFANNVMGKAYVDRNSFILLRGAYNMPVVITGNVMDVEESGKLYTHFLFCKFQNGLRMEGNRGIRPYFNQCTLMGDVVIDDMLNTYKSDFSNCELHTVGDRFPEVRMTNYDPSQVLLANDQASVTDSAVTLTAYDQSVVVPAPTDYIYTIADEADYVAGEGVTFAGSSDPKCINTGIELLKDGGDFTIFLRYFGTDTATIDSGYIPLFMMYDYDAAKGGLIFGSRYKKVYTSVTLISGGSAVDLNTSYGYLKRSTGTNFIMRRKGAKIQFWLCQADEDAASMTQHLIKELDVPGTGFDGQTGTLLIGARDGYYGDNTRALDGRMETFEVYSRALSDNEISMLLYGKNLAEDEQADPSESVVYDIASDEHYDVQTGCVEFDGTFGIDTGVALFAGSDDFTVAAQFQFANYHDAGMLNFSFIPVLSAMNYTENYKASPGVDIGLSLQQGDQLDTIAKGGFVMIRNSWKFSNAKYLDSARYFAYDSVKYGVILIRQNGVLSVYDYNM